MKLNRPALATVLRHVANAVESGDSLEGSIEWLIPEHGSSQDLEVTASVRTGNLDGQGGVLLISPSPADEVAP